MPKRNLILPAAVFGLAGFIGMFIYVSIGIGTFDPDREGHLDPGGVRRQSVEQSLLKILPSSAASMEDPGLETAANQLASEPYIAWVWVTNPEGKLTFVHGGPAHSGDSVRELSLYEEDIIMALEPALRTKDAELELRLAAALRREGEHNDIYRHLVRSIPGPDGETAAFIGIAYEAADTAPGAADIALLIFGVAGFLVYWLGLPLWVALDSRAGGGGRSSILWGLFVLVANAAGLLAYLLVRHRNP
ncbi:MAG: hypothetical protein WBM17_11575 [Anaerolineales bacterium]